MTKTSLAMQYLACVATFVRRTGLAAVLLLAGFHPAFAGPDLARTVAFDIAPQQLSAALLKYSEQSGIQVTSPSKLVYGKSSGGVVGSFAARSALERILAGTELKYEVINSNTVAIVSAADAAVPSRADFGTDTQAEQEKGLRLVRAQVSSADGNSSTAGQDTEEKQGTSKSGSGAEGKLEEIVVTAQKRAERLEDVPMSISVVSADDIDRRGLVSAEDYLRGMPGVNQTTDHIGQTIIIRGIQTFLWSQNLNFGTTVATYFDETSTTASAGLLGTTNIDVRLADIERVEVLRGPQGTSFGNASLGGTVRTIPVAPKLDRVEGRIGANYSVTSGSGGANNSYSAIGNLPIIKDKLALRASGYRFDDSGFYRNRAGSDPGFQAAIAPYGVQAYALDKDEVGGTAVTGGRVAALYQATDDLRMTFTYLKQRSQADGHALATSGTYEQTVLQVAPEHVHRGQTGGLFDQDLAIANAKLEYSFGWGNLLATFSHLNGGSMYSYPLSASNALYPASYLGTATHREHNGEIRMTTQLKGKWNFLAGLYAEELDDSFGANYYWYGTPQSNFLGSTAFLGDYLELRNLKQKAAFGEVTWEFLPGFTFTGGARYYDYDRDRFTDKTGIFGLGVSTLAVDQTGASFRANLSRKFNENTLVYAGWSQGFRLGTPQSGLLPGLCDRDNDGVVDGTANVTIAQTSELKSDEVDNYELGAKFTLLDRRLMLTADVYRINWTGVPVTTQAPAAPIGCGMGYNANAGSARSEGVEVQANFYVTRAFRVDIGGSYVHARLTEDVPALNTLAGARLAGTPEYNANLGLQYEFKIAGYDAFVRADPIYVGTFFGGPQETDQMKGGGYIKVDGVARLTIKSLDIDLFVRNLTNQDNFSSRLGYNIGPFWGYRLRPRTVGVQLGYKF